MDAEKKLTKIKNCFATVNRESIGFFLKFRKFSEINGLLESWPHTLKVIPCQY